MRQRLRRPRRRRRCGQYGTEQHLRRLEWLKSQRWIIQRIWKPQYIIDMNYIYIEILLTSLEDLKGDTKEIILNLPQQT